jgi:hypothetical protein
MRTLMVEKRDHIGSAEQFGSIAGRISKAICGLRKLMGGYASNRSLVVAIAPTTADW